MLVKVTITVLQCIHSKNDIVSLTKTLSYKLQGHVNCTLIIILLQILYHHSCCELRCEPHDKEVL